MSATSPIAAAAHVRESRAGAYLALVAAIMCIAWSAIFVRWTDIPGPASAFYRLLIPAVVLLPTFLWDRGKSRPSLKTILIIAVGGVFFALDLAMYNTAILKTSAANATLLGNNSPIVVGLLSWLVFSRRPSKYFWLGLLLAVSGTLVIVWRDLGHYSQLGIGDLLSIGAAVCFAVYLLATEQVRAHIGTLSFLRLAILFSMMALFVLNLAMGISLRVPTTQDWLALLGLGLVSQLGGYLALTYALGHLPATITSISLLIQVPLTALLAALLLHESVAPVQILGGLLTLAGIALAHRQTHPEDEANI